MKAVICTRYGPPEVLQVKDVDKPIPKDNEILIRIHSTAATASDCVIRNLQVPGGHQFPAKQLMQFAMRLFLGYTKPRNPILGLVFSGVVESVGKNANYFAKGDAVFGFTGNSRGAYAEYKCISSKEIEAGEVFLKPNNASHNEATAIAYGGILALHFMRKATIKKEHKVLIYGASGSIGTMAIQLAKCYVAEVTAACSAKNFDLVASLGADKWLDYTRADAIHQVEKYDFILDAVGKNKTSKMKAMLKKSLSQNGSYVSVDDGLLKIQPDYLRKLKMIFEDGNIQAVIDKIYPLKDIVKAHAYVDKGHKKGNAIIQVKN